MSLHFPLPKIRTFRFSLHTSCLSLHGEVTIVALKFTMRSHFPLPKIFSPSLFPILQMVQAARRVIENPRQMIKSCPVIFFSSHWKTESMGSAEALPILCVRYFRWERERDTEREGERERDRDGSDVTIVALKLAMNSPFHLPKFRTIGDELALSLAKNSHFSFLPSHFLSLPSRRGHHCGAEFHNEFTLSIAKNFFALFVPPPSNGTSRTTSDRKQDKWSSDILFFPSKNWIKLIPKTIGNRKRDCAWGGSGW